MLSSRGMPGEPVSRERHIPLIVATCFYSKTVAHGPVGNYLTRQNRASSLTVLNLRSQGFQAQGKTVPVSHYG